MLSVPAAPDALVHEAAAQLTSLAAHDAAPPTGGVNAAASACSDIRSCLLAVANTMLATVTVAGDAAVAFAMSLTANDTPAGTVTQGLIADRRGQRGRLAGVSRVTVVCAPATVAPNRKAAAPRTPQRTTPNEDGRGIKRSFSTNELTVDERRFVGRVRHRTSAIDGWHMREKSCRLMPASRKLVSIIL